MNEDFVPFELAKKLKEKGFRESCGYVYNYKRKELEYKKESTIWNNSEYWYAAPTISQVLKWLREEKKIFIAINIGYCYESYEKPFPTNPKMEPILIGYYYGIWELGNLNDRNALSKYFEAPKQAALAGIEYCLDNLI